MKVKLKSLNLWLLKYFLSVKTRVITKLMLLAMRRWFDAFSLPERDFQTVISRVSNEGFSFLTKKLPELGKAVELGISTGHFDCPSQFKKRTKSATPAFLGSLLTSVFDYRTGDLLENADPSSVYAIRQICYYFYKVDAPRKSELDSRVLRSFVETERELGSMELKFDAILKVASILIKDIFRDYNRDRLKFKHGPGVTSDTPISKKWERRLRPGRVHNSFGKFNFFNENAAMDQINRFPVYSTQDYFMDNHKAKVLLVPKDSRGPRLISCEPADHQYVQQGLMEYMVSRIETGSIASGYVNFTDQSVNYDLAKKASQDRSLSTLDLKDASDRNSLALFNALFSLVPELRDDILSCRTGSTLLPDGTEVHLSKFAPMGSALCFPVMAITLWAIQKAYLIGIGSEDCVYVYGDDIIVPTKHAIDCIHVIERYGFKVNKQKSFVNSYFAESCGGDFFKGVNVTPVRCRTIFDIDKLCRTTKKPLATVRMVKHAHELDFIPELSEFWYSLSELLLGFLLPFGTAKSPYLCRLDESPTTKNRRLVESRRRGAYKCAHIVADDFVEEETTSWGHFHRIWRGIGNSDKDTPYSVFNLPKRWQLRIKKLGLKNPF